MVDIFELTVRVVNLMRLDGDVDQALVSLRNHDEGEIEMMLDEVRDTLGASGVEPSAVAPLLAQAARWREECRTLDGIRRLAGEEEALRALLASALCVPGYGTTLGGQPLLYEGEGLLLYVGATAPLAASLLSGGSEGGSEALFDGDAQLLHPHEAALLRSHLATVPTPRSDQFPDLPGPAASSAFLWETPLTFRPRHREVPDPIRVRVPGGDVAIFSLSGLGAALKNLTAICERANAHGSLRIAVERTRWPKPTA